MFQDNQPTSFRKTLNLEVRQNPTNEKGKRYYRARISSGDLDSHYSYMDISTLENFARESANGVAVLDSHNHRTVGIGRSVSGELINGAVESDFFILEELPLNNQSFQNSSAFPKAIDAGMIKDVSVGFYGHEERCNICGTELWRGGCTHWPGDKYEIEDDDGTKKIVTATTTIYNGHLSEFSLVYDGALEGAEIIERAKKSNFRFNNNQRKDLQDRFGVEIESIEPSDTKKQPDTIPVKPIRGVSKMSIQNDKQDRIAQLEEEKALLEERCQKAEDAATNELQTVARLEQAERDLKHANEKAKNHESIYEKEKKTVKMLEEKLEELQPKAESFEKFKEEEIKLALDALLGAYPGEPETSERYLRNKRSLERANSIDQIRDDRAKWEEMAADNTPDGPQLDSNDENDHPPVISTPKKKTAPSPANAF